MGLKDTLNLLKESNAYKEWDKGDYYLVHFFMITGHPFQVGYYSASTKKAVCFEMHDTVTRLAESDILREDDSPLLELDIPAVAREFDDALGIAKKLTDQKYPHESVSKEILMLQTLKEGIIYNMTFLTMSQHLINVKIDASTSEVKSYEMHSIMDFAKPLDKD